MRVLHLVHYHTFKNAGSTIDSVLQREFGSAWRSIEPEPSEPRLDAEMITEVFGRFPSIQAISSHNFALPFFRPRGDWFAEICVIRHPLDRIRSVYGHWRRMKEAGAVCPYPTSNFPKFLDYLAEFRPCEFSNAQVIAFGNFGDCYFPASENTLERAWAALKEARVLCTVEKLTVSLAIAEFYLRQIQPQLNLAFAPKNCGSFGERPSLEVRLQNAMHEAGAQRWTNLEKANQLDMQLWEFTSREVDRRLAATACIGPHLSAFEERCRRLSESEKLRRD